MSKDTPTAPQKQMYESVLRMRNAKYRLGDVVKHLHFELIARHHAGQRMLVRLRQKFHVAGIGQRLKAIQYFGSVFFKLIQCHS